MKNTKSAYSQLIKSEAQKLGFMFCGISKADFLEQEAPRLEKWLSNKFHGEMYYMENNFDKRLDPRKLVDGAKSVISLALNYYSDEFQKDPEAPRVSKYAFGTDYHFVIKDKLKMLMEYIQDNIGEVAGRAFVDSAPILDKAWAKEAGFGWIGKNTNLLNTKSGSFFFLAELVVDLDLEYDLPQVKDYCGTCTRCIDACPTDAIIAPYIVDGSRCISYLTIELKNEIPLEFKGKTDNWMFGCDVCQDVCPWNSFSTVNKEPAFQPVAELLDMTSQEWEEITIEVFNKVFKDSAVKRSRFTGLQRNIEFLKPARS